MPKSNPVKYVYRAPKADSLATLSLADDTDLPLQAGALTLNAIIENKLRLAGHFVQSETIRSRFSSK